MRYDKFDKGCNLLYPDDGIKVGVPQLGGLSNAVFRYRADKIAWLNLGIALITWNV